MLANRFPLLLRSLAAVALLTAWTVLGEGARSEGLDPDLPVEMQLAGAIDSGSVVAVRRMLEAGADPNAAYEGTTPLERSIRRGKSYVANLLCQTGADVDRRDEQGWPPLFWAAAQGEVQIARLLLEHGADVNVVEPRFGFSALQVAAGHGHAKIVELLLENGARLDHRDRWQGNALNEAAFAGHRGIVRLLAERGLAIEWPLHVAAGLGDRERVVELLDQGADINGTTRGWSNTPLAYAVGGGHQEIAQMLLERGAKLDVRNVAGANLLHIAAEHGRMKIATWLLEQDESLRAAVDNEGLTPLDWSRSSAIRQLLESQRKTADQRSVGQDASARSDSSS